MTLTARDDLERRLLAAHEAEDAMALVTLYTQAADVAEAARNTEAACFYLTHAFVFALECGAPEADLLNLELAERGRAHRLTGLA